MFYLTNVLGIKDPIHKQKIALKAMDVVLFGAPKGMNSAHFGMFGIFFFFFLARNLLLLITRCKQNIYFRYDVTIFYKYYIGCNFLLFFIFWDALYDMF